MCENNVGSLKETAREWAKKVNIDSVEKLNAVVKSGHFTELILICEAMQQNSIYEIAKRIVSENRKLVLIAGPSSAGKTTFSQRLGIQLRAMGQTPHPIAADNFFVNREDNPKDENGNYDFECIEAVDLEKLNDDMLALLRGETVEIPNFNFKLGVREYNGDFLSITENDVVIMEGIHALNPQMTFKLDQSDMFKIYISPLNQLYIDEDNKVSTMDGRLIRRIVRDNRLRGNDAASTISMWKKVRDGEEKHIFPYENQANVMFNSGLLYEYSVLKPFAMPLIYELKYNEKYAEVAGRLIKLMDLFEEAPLDMVPCNSIVREFVGGGCFRV